MRQNLVQPAPELRTPARPETGQVPGYAWVVLSGVFLASVAAPLNQFKVPPLMPVLMAQFQVSLAMAGLLMSVFAVTGFLLALPAGFIFQKLGARTTGLLAGGCLVAGAALGALANTAGVLLASRVVEGMGMGLIAVVAPAVIAMWFPAGRRGIPMGLWATWVPLGSVLMYNLAPALERAYGWPAVWWFGAAFALVAYGFYAAVLRAPAASFEPAEPAGEGPAAEPPGLGQALRNGQVWLLSLEFGCFNLVVLALGTFLPTFLAAERGYTMAAAAFVASLVMTVTLVSAPLAGWLSDRLGSRKLVMAAPFLALALLLLLPFNLTGWLIPAYMILLGLAAGAIPAATFAAVPEVMGKPHLAGMGMAIVALGQNLGMFIGPVAFGRLVEATSWATAGYLLIPVALAGFLAAWRVNVR